MPEYQVTLKIDDAESMTPRGAAEGVYMELLRDLMHGQLKLELKDKETGKVEHITLGEDLENDESLLRFMALMMVAVQFMTEEQKRELTEWEAENIDGHSVGTSDWPGWEPLIGKLPKKFRKSSRVM